MTRLVISDRAKPRLEIREPRARRRIGPEEIEKALGAERIEMARAGGSPMAAYAIRRDLFGRLRSTGGRPRLDGADVKPKIPMRRASWNRLQQLAKQAEKEGYQPTAAHLASAILEAGLANYERHTETEGTVASPQTTPTRQAIAPRGRSQFLGSAGQYHVAYCLAVRGIHAAITLGNVPEVDIVAASENGSRLLAIQVKTSRSAYRPRRYGYELREWDVGAGAVDRWSPALWYAFVDLQEENNQWTPIVFIVPSLWVGKFVKPDWSRKMYMLRSMLWQDCQERWDRIHDYLAGDAGATAWGNRIPAEAQDWDSSGRPIP
jgi:hypothetical protein